MDELLGLIVLIGVGIVSSHLKTKKAQQKSARKTNGFDEAVESMREGKKNVSREVLAQFMPELMEDEEIIQAKPAVKKAEPAQPTVKSADPVIKPAEPIVKPAAPAAKPAGPALKRSPKAPFVQKAVSQPAPVLFMDHDEPEGTVSTQGESAAEHAEHRRKILAEEEAIRMEHEALQELRHMNLQKLRTAVVMSEILDKPVSLRRRRS